MTGPLSTPATAAALEQFVTAAEAEYNDGQRI
jgi:hypothetical protein